MTDSTLIADLIRSGLDPDLVQRVTMALMQAQKEAPVAILKDEAAERRRAKDRERKAIHRPLNALIPQNSADSAEKGESPLPLSPSLPFPPQTPPSPAHPHTPAPVRTCEEGQKAAKTKTSKTDWREWNQRKADAANIVSLPLLAPPDFGAAWQRWCDYRTARATTTRIASESLDWTEAAAKSTLIAAEKAAEWNGWPAVISRIDEAIGGNWQGPNFDKIQPKSGFTSSSSMRPQSSSCL